ncbi:MAG: LamG domain-containing protein [Candidatus Omnitrophica bacterium]|nr:LamG domain-containing protein [Candidatus Omnitrophota bacterium]
MMIRMPKGIWPWLILSLWFSSGLKSNESPLSPWSTDPLLRELTAEIVFYLSFDGGNMKPEMALGLSDYRLTGQPKFVPGLKELALTAGGGKSGYAVYSSKLNFPIATQGTMIMWVCPVAWTHYNGPNTIFAMTTNFSFYLERQGPGHNEKGELTRQEAVLFLVNTPTTGNNCINFGTNNWPSGKWRMLAAVWKWPEMALSVDAGTFSVRSVKKPPLAQEFGDLLVGALGGEETLIDEVYVFKKALTKEELQKIYQAFSREFNQKGDN